MRPVHEAAEVVPLVHATKSDPVTNGDWNPAGKIYVVSNKQRLPAAQLQYEALMA